MVHHTREDALSDREFERLCAATHHVDDYDDDYHGLQCRFVILVAGRLGLRAGEIAHMTEEWVDERDKMIRIPAHEACDKGRDEQKCGYCRKQARQMHEWSRERYLEAYHRLRETYGSIHARAEIDAMVRDQEGVRPRSYEECLDQMWSPKTDAGARDVPYDANTRAAIVLEDFFAKYGRWPLSRQGINRRVNLAAEAADELDVDDVYPHCLRATAGEYYAAKGLDVIGLKQLMGWAQFSTAECYISGSGEATARKLRQLPG